MPRELLVGETLVVAARIYERLNPGVEWRALAVGDQLRWADAVARGLAEGFPGLFAFSESPGQEPEEERRDG